MVLSDRELVELIKNASLRIEPFVAEAIGPCSIDVRFGSEYIIGSHTEPLLYHIALGEEALLPSMDTCIFTSLETIEMPSDLVGILYGSSAYQRHGAVIPSVRIDPAFRGKLVLTMHNISRWSIRLISGIRVASIQFHKLSEQAARLYAGATLIQSSLDHLMDAGFLRPGVRIGKSDLIRTFVASVEHQKLVEQQANIRGRVLRDDRPSDVTLQRLFASINRQGMSSDDKGEALEEFVGTALQLMQGLRVIKRDARLAAEEIDFLIENRVESLFWQSLGTPMLVECKNWTRAVGVDEVTNLIGKMEAVGPSVRTALLVAVNGISGDRYRDAQLRRREGRQKGRNVLVLIGKDLEEIAFGIGFDEVVAKRHDELLLI